MRVGVANSKRTSSALALYSALASRLRRLPRTATRSCLRQFGRVSARNSLLRLGHLAGFFPRLIDAPDHVEGLLGHVVAEPLHDLLEALDRIGKLDVAARGAREVLGHVEGLGEEALELPRAGHGKLVLVGELLHPEDGDDVLKILVTLEDRLHGPGCRVVLLAQDDRIENARGGGEGIDGRVDSEFGERPRQNRRRVEVGEGRGGRGIGDVVGRHVDGLHRGDRALLGRGDPLLKRAHLGAEGRLVADGRGHTPEERRDLRARLGEPEDIVNEEQHVLPFLIAEVLGGRHPGQPDAETRAGRLGHLAEDERRLVDDARLLHLVVQVIALARALPYPGEDRDAPVLLGNIVDELLDEHGLADARAPEEARLAASGIGLEKIHNLDAGLEHLYLGRLLLEGRRGPVDGQGLRRLERPRLIHGLARDIEDAAQRLLAHGDRDRLAHVIDWHAAGEPVGRRHGNGTHAALAQVLGNLENQLGGIREDVGAARAGHLEGVVDRGQLAHLELNVDHGADDLDNLALAHLEVPFLNYASTAWRRASAPPTISRSSLVMRSWRALLYWMVSRLIISRAFFEAASIAVMRAPYSPAADSMRAR